MRSTSQTKTAGWILQMLRRTHRQTTTVALRLDLSSLTILSFAFIRILGRFEINKSGYYMQMNPRLLVISSEHDPSTFKVKTAQVGGAL